MVDLAEIQAAYYMVAATGVLVAAAYYVLNMRQTIENRKAQLFTQLTSIQFQKDFVSNFNELLNINWKDFDDFARKYDSGVNHNHYVQRAQIFNYLEQLGFYARKGQLNVEQLTTIGGGGFAIVWLWRKYESIIKRYREVLNLPEYYVNFQYLAEAMAEYEKAKGHEITPNQAGGAYFPDEK